MKRMAALAGVLILCSISMCSTMPPCSPEELLESSDYAIEGYVITVECGKPYNSGECKPWKIIGEPVRGSNYRPELVADCIALVEVTAQLKGNYTVGNEVRIPFLKVIQECENGERTTFGEPKKDFRITSKVRYYNSSSCAYSNFEELEPPKRGLKILEYGFVITGIGIGILVVIWIKKHSGL